ncbi:ATP-binding protein, partial [Streptomyces sp. IBSBF 2435]|uniref:ATP-binding protein n=1 Tax=Streptomyces sp. IBSBF 2435 TaxID=2903531 RepID=UPI002FDC693A
MASRDRTDVPELIGRAREKKVLGEALLHARRGEGRAVFLVGEGGIGKSRLVLEATALARDAGMLVLLGRASRTGPSSAMRPLAEALASLFRDGSGPSRAEIGPYHAALGGLVLEYGPGGAAGDTTAVSRTAVGDATDAPGPDGTGGRHGRTGAADRVDSSAPSPLMLAEAILRLTAAAGAGRGCLLVLEDLHDADEQTLAVVEYLADNIAGQGSVLLATVRHDPGTAGDLAHALARRGNAVLLRPKRFSRGEVALLAGSGLGVSPASLPTEAVSRLWRDSAGNPLVADELLHAMASAGMLVVDPQGCRFDTEAGLELPFAVGHRITQHVRQLGAEMDRMLRTAAVIGERFPVSVLQRVLGTSQRKLLDHLRAALAAEVLQGCGPTADWYGFRDPITRTALLSQFAPTHRTALARRAADAVEQLHPGLPDIWCEFTAGLRSAADDPVSAAVLCGRAGRRALAAGLAGSAAELLERAWVLSDGAGEPGLRADLLDGLLTAFAETGRAGQGLEFIDLPQTFHAGATEPSRLAGLHIRLARLAAAAGRRAEGRRQVQLAQAALGTGATDRDSAVLDTVAAWVLSDSPREAELRAARAVATTERAGLPDARCRALTARGALAMRHGSAEASHWLTRARTAALAHSLPLRRLEATYLLAEDEWLARGDRAALLNARGEADRLGAGFIAHIAGSRLALDHALRGEYAAADRLAADCAAEAERLGLRDSARYLLTVRAVCAGHQGRRAELDLLGAESRRCPGDPAPTRSLALGLAGVVCALLEEDRDRAARVMAEATRHDHDSPAPHPLVGQYGLFRLVTAVRGGPAPLPGPRP